MAQRRLTFLTCSCVTFLVFGGGVAVAEDMQCQNRIVTAGDASYEVRLLCGAPDVAERRVEVRRIRRQVAVACTPQGAGRCTAFVDEAVEVTIDEWIYDFGPHRFIRFLRFEQGRLIDIQSGGYGHKLS